MAGKLPIFEALVASWCVARDALAKASAAEAHYPSHSNQIERKRAEVAVEDASRLLERHADTLGLPERWRGGRE